MPTPARRAGILTASFLHFDVSFMCWVMIGALGAVITKDLHLSPSQKGLLVAVPVLSGAVSRIVIGLIADSWSIKRAGYITILGAAAGLTLGAAVARSYGAVLGVGILLGVSGASFAVSLPLASRWFPRERQGIALGIAGAGNSGTVIATFFAPRLAAHVGWAGTMAIAIAPLAVMALSWTLLAREPAVEPHRFAVREVLRKRDLLLLGSVYSVTFGGFVGLVSFMPVFLSETHHLSAISAGNITALAALLGSGARPIGGLISDRVGGRVVAGTALGVVAAASFAVGAHVSVGVTATALFLMLAALGAGNGAVFQLVPQCFAREIAVVTGLVGAAGGLGGFLLPTMLGTLRDATGTYATGFGIFAVMATGAIGILAVAGRRWRRTWLSPAAATVIGRVHRAEPAASVIG